MTATANTQVVESLFQALTVDDVDAAIALLTDDVAWLNTGAPTIRGRRVRSALRAMPKARIKFSCVIDVLEDEGDTVRFDRTDTLRLGPLRSDFYVRGRFDIRDGKVARWDDRFSPREFLVGFFRRERAAG